MAAIFVSLIILVVLTFRKVNVLIAAPVSAVVLMLFNKMPIVQTLNTAYMGGVSGFIQAVWLMILLGAIFGKLMDETGAATSIAKLIINTFGVQHAALAVILASALLTYGGIQSMVIVFAIYPITLSLFRKADLSRTLIPGVIGAGAFTFPSMLPGSPQALNIIPTTYLGTTVMAAPVVGILSSVVCFTLIYLYFRVVIAREKKQGICFVADDSITKSLAQADEMEEKGTLPNPWLALIPPVLVVVTLNVAKWDILASLLIGCIACVVLFYKNLLNVFATLTAGSSSAALAVLNTGAVIGIGSVIKSTEGFQKIVDSVINFGGNPLVAFGAATSILAGVTASGTGGISITLESLATPFLEMGVNPEILHRIGTIACLGLDSLPHSGGIVTLLIVTGISHREGYKHLFVTTVLITTITLVFAIALGTVMYPIG